MAGREEESLDVEIDGMELDEDCLVRVGRAGASGAGADAPNPAQKEACESRLSTKDQWTERLAMVDAHLCPLMDNFFQRQIFGRSEEEHALVFNQMSRTSWIAAQAGHLSCALFWFALPSAHGGIQSNFNKILVSICVSTMGGAWTDMETFVVPEKLGQARYLRNAHWCVAVTALWQAGLMGAATLEQTILA
jgi:hypothetical protein